MEKIKVSIDNYIKLVEIKKKYEFEDFDETINFLIDKYG